MPDIDLDDLERRMHDHDVIGGRAAVILDAAEVQAIIAELRSGRGADAERTDAIVASGGS